MIICRTHSIYHVCAMRRSLSSGDCGGTAGGESSGLLKLPKGEGLWGLAILSKEKVDYWLMMLMAKNNPISKFLGGKDPRIGCHSHNLGFVRLQLDVLLQVTWCFNLWIYPMIDSQGLAPCILPLWQWHRIWSWVLPHAKFSAQYSYLLDFRVGQTQVKYKTYHIPKLKIPVCIIMAPFQPSA